MSKLMYLIHRATKRRPKEAESEQIASESEEGDEEETVSKRSLALLFLNFKKKKKEKKSWAVVVQRQADLSLRPAWSTKQVPGQPELLQRNSALKNEAKIIFVHV